MRSPGGPVGGRLRMAVGVVLVALFAVSCTNTSPVPPSPSAPPPSPTTSAKLAIGTVRTEGGPIRGCVRLFRCRAITVTCPGVERPARAVLQIQQPGGRARGAVVYFSGQTGQRPWAESDSASAQGFVHSLVDAHLVNVMVVWIDPWFVSAPGE